MPACWGRGVIAQDTNAMDAPEKLRIRVQAAELAQSFTKVGWMTPYVVVSSVGVELFRTSADRRAHKTPTWNSEHAVRCHDFPENLTLAVYTHHRLKKDVLCGTLTLPCDEDMGVLEAKNFALTKNGKMTGTIRVSFAVASPQDKRYMSTVSCGGEVDNVIDWLEKGFKNDPTLEAQQPLFLAENSEETAKPALAPEDDAATRPTLLSRQVSVLSRAVSGLFPAVAPDDAAAKNGSPVALDSDGLAFLGALSGHWNCVNTQGLDEFLKVQGYGSWQRKLAQAAKWPSWDFTGTGTQVSFVNHSAMGDLKENIQLDGCEYTWCDGRKNLLTCTAKWTPMSNGGNLTIWRSNAQIKYHEERIVEGNKLTFIMHGDGISWGRTFERRNN